MTENTGLIEKNSPYSGEEMEIDLTELMYRFLARWKLIAVFAILGMLLAYLITASVITPQYRATSTIYVLSRSDSAINMSDLQIGTALTSDYIKVFDMWEVHAEVIYNLDLPYSYTEMKNMLSVVNDSGTRMLDINVTSPYPDEAADIANEYAKVVSQYIAETMSTDRPNIMSTALVPTKPISPSKTKNMVIGFMLGALIAAAYVFIGFMVDDKFKTADDIRKYTGLATLAVLPVESESLEVDQKRQRGNKA